jgi:predicted DsbA family dithiol-disulfide isomerase
MASVTHRIRSTSIEAQEFPELAGRYEVRSVPKIVVNDSHAFTGGLPEKQFVEAVLVAVNGTES